VRMWVGACGDDGAIGGGGMSALQSCGPAVGSGRSGSDNTSASFALMSAPLAMSFLMRRSGPNWAQ
jgi:hypothetical protein